MAAFIVLEGGEGSGKSTQAALLVERLRALGLAVTQTFEPGATARGAKIREMLLADDTSVDARAELLLMVADRAQHVAEVIRPALDRGDWVVSDRFEPSTLAYQGVGRGLGVGQVGAVSEFARGDVKADLVVVLDVSEEEAAHRRPTPRDRMERAGDEFHAKVRAAYRELAADRGWRIVDGVGSADDVADRVWHVVQAHCEVIR